MIEHKEGRTGDSQVLQNIHQQMAGNCFCLLGESAVMPIKSALHFFEDEFLALEH
jgi:NADH-quinone oxidoreductase subunit F